MSINISSHDLLKNSLVKLFFIYCVVVSVFITFSNLFLNTSPNLLPSLLFLPTTLYFVHKLFQALRTNFLFDKSSKITFNQRTPSRTDIKIISLFLSLLIAVSIYNIFMGTKAESLVPITPQSDYVQSPQISTSSAELQSDSTLKVFSPNTGFASIRSEATTSAEIITRVSTDSILTITGQSANWYQVQLDAQTYGWIHQSLTQIP